MAYTQLDQDHDRITDGGKSTKDCDTQIAAAYADHMASFTPIAMPLSPSSPPCVPVVGSAPALRKTLTPNIFKKHYSVVSLAQAVLDAWANQFIQMGFIVAPPLTGAFAPGPTYAAAFTQLIAINTKLSVDFSIKDKKFSSWARENELVFQTNVGFVQYIGQINGTPHIYNIIMQPIG